MVRVGGGDETRATALASARRILSHFVTVFGDFPIPARHIGIKFRCYGTREILMSHYAMRSDVANRDFQFSEFDQLSVVVTI